MNVLEWESAAPWVNWRDPLEVRLLDGATVHYACRVCIATRGLQGRDLARLPTDPEEVRRHIARAHAGPQGALRRERA